MNIRIRPSVDFGSLEDVLVVLVPARPATEDPADPVPGAGTK